MKIVSIMWDAYLPLMKKAANEANIDLSIHANRILESSPEICQKVADEFRTADLILLYKTTHRFWDEIDDSVKHIREKVPVISVGYEASYWSLTSVSPKVAAEVYLYLVNSGEENFQRLMQYLLFTFGESDKKPLPPLEVPWQGIVHPHAGKRIFTTTDEYLDWYSAKPNNPWVGVLISRVAWISEESEIEKTLIADLEAVDINVIPAFTHSLQNDEVGSLNIAGVINRYFVSDGKPRVNAIVKLVTFMIGKTETRDTDASAKKGAELLASLNIPVFEPITAFYATLSEWEHGSGISADITWTVAMPEFEGMIEPIMLGATHNTDQSKYERTVLSDRSKKISRRIKRWLTLQKKHPEERKIVFFLNNNPCAGLEANIGGAAHLDVAKSVVSILHHMEKHGYAVTPPQSAKDLMDMFLDKKAISEFRWTTKSEIVQCGGAIYQMPSQEYQKYFSSLSPMAQEKMLSVWGEPPGEGMVLNNEILITGLQFGNAIIAVQPKRGCFGATCDGSVCKILHDPDCPPTHQYLATYHYYNSIFGADAFIHVGTHGNLEFLPGKGTALSEHCFPDIAIGDVPFLYIYNTDNPPEGTTAKRRSYATLVGHMQTVMTSASLYDEYAELDQLLAQYETAKYDPGRCHALHHMILDAVAKAKLDDLCITHDMPMEETVQRCHEALTLIRTSKMDSGMHIFGNIPDNEKKIEMISSILHFDAGKENISLRRIIAEMFDLDYTDLLKNPGGFHSAFGMSNGAILEWIDEKVKLVIHMVLFGSDVDAISEALGRKTSPEFSFAIEKILDLNERIIASDELGSLMNGLFAGYIPPGPSGLVTRGRDDVLPSGRNFYSLDPHRVPTTSAWRVGSRLAEILVAKQLEESGKYPETVAFYWMAGDIMTADGEMMAEIFSLLGVMPVWEKNGQVKSFSVVAPDDLARPRIDVIIRTSGILRDNFTNCIDLVDKAVIAVAELDEPPEINFVRKHVIQNMAETGTSLEDATARLFSGKPGTYTSGVNLAVLAGAWKNEKDLAEIYITTNGYAYGNSRGGVAAHEQFAANLETVSVTFNKIVSDEHDLLGCCCYFGNQGGLTAAARHLSGKTVKTYYGDTREPSHVEVRTLADELRRVVRAKLLNPKWIEGMKEHGYKGAADIMQRVTRVYGWEASTQEVDDWIFDDIAETFVNDPDMKQFFEENNPYALEEISRRLLEANSRGLWDPDPDVFEKLRNSYLEIESWLEDRCGEGEFQGGTVDIITADEVAGWGEQISEVMAKVHGRKK